MIVKGERSGYIQILQLLLNYRPPNVATHLQLRLFLKPLKKIHPNDNIYWQASVQGKTFCESIVSKYTKILADNQHELFLESKKITNSSLRKFHTNKLAEAEVPLKVQQESLGENTRFYTRGADDLERKKKVADIVCGERAFWPSPAGASSSVTCI